MKSRLIYFAIVLIALPFSVFAQGLTYEEQLHDFGHIGIDFKVQTIFHFVNRTDVPVKVFDIEVSCDCTSVRSADTLIEPGDTAFFHLSFLTKDYYGPVNKSFTVKTDHPKLPKLEYFYLSVVGQWFNGIRPNPISLFFLPSKKTQTIKVPNKAFDEISIVSVSNSNEYFKTQILTESAKKGDKLEVEVSPLDGLEGGTYLSSVSITIKTEGDENTILSIPVKIVKY